MQKNPNPTVTQTPYQAERSRRRLLQRVLLGTASVAAIPALVRVALADDVSQAKGGGRRRGKGAKSKGMVGGPPSDHVALASRLIEEFDKDGDGALGRDELAAAIKASHEGARWGQTEERDIQSSSGSEVETGRRKRGRKGGGAATEAPPEGSE